MFKIEKCNFDVYKKKKCNFDKKIKKYNEYTVKKYNKYINILYNVRQIKSYTTRILLISS